MKLEKSNPLKEIFELQASLMTKFNSVEQNHGLLQTQCIPVDLQSWKGQARLRDFAWRMTEELCEALQAQEKYLAVVGIPSKLEVAKERENDLKEELIDVLHFFVEFCILCDYPVQAKLENPQTLHNLLCDEFSDNFSIHQQPKLFRFREFFVNFVENMGKTINLLKNRPWRQSPRPTDTVAFYLGIDHMWLDFGTLLWCVDLTSDQVYYHYVEKHRENQRRQEAKL